MSKRKRSAEKEAFWRMVLQEYEVSGQTAREFCRLQEIPLPSFYGWRREIAKRDAEANVSPTTPDTALVPVTIVDECPSVARGGEDGRVEVLLPTGATVRFNDSIDLVRLQNVLRAVSQLDAGAPQC